MSLKTRICFIIMMLTLLTFVAVGCDNGVVGPGPNLLSEKETIRIVKKEAAIVEINSVEMSTAGPIYRVVFGTDGSGNEKAVWVSDKVIFVKSLEDGISQEEAWQIARDKGFNDDAELQLIYVPQDNKTDFPSGEVYWWFVQNGNEQNQHSLYLNFNTGEVVREEG